MNPLHPKPLTLPLALLDPHLLKVHIRAVKDCAGIARIWTLLRAKSRELRALWLLGGGVVLSGDGVDGGRRKEDCVMLGALGWVMGFRRGLEHVSYLHC